MGGLSPVNSYLKNFEKARIEKGIQVYKNSERTRQYTWDSKHGEIEVFDKAGYHLGVLDGATGKLTKGPVKARKIGKLN